jgi:hypothetical protein
MADSFGAQSVRAHRFDAAPAAILGLGVQPATLTEALAAIGARASRSHPFTHVCALTAACAFARWEDQGFARFNASPTLGFLAARQKEVLPALSPVAFAHALFTQEIAARETVAIVGLEEDQVEALAARFALKDVRWRRAPRDGVGREKAAAFIAAQGARFVFLGEEPQARALLLRAVYGRGDAVGMGLCLPGALETLAGGAPSAAARLSGAAAAIRLAARWAGARFGPRNRRIDTPDAIA